MIIKTHVSLDSAHKLDLPYKSKCNNLHGHRWEIDVIIEGAPDETGMIVDFGKVKEYLAQYDHCYLNGFIPVPTAENLAECFAIGVKHLSVNIKEVRIEVAETPKNVAVYICK